ncbi:MAG: U32 family peptidase [Bacteroidales bacterium]|jgi:putative protease|nr:U32 family peptidase [Bacteroidales bacterium]
MEVLSPVGSFAALSAAFQANADAVYFGLGALNMRAKAAVNFAVNDLAQIMAQCREHNVKAYLALNTVVFDGELGEISSILNEAVICGVDAIIASDIAVITEARKRGLAVHLSTQCNVTNIEAVRFYAQFADVIVLARELSLKQIANITQQIADENICGASGLPVKIEIFVHGAFCMATSGKCYLSLDNFNKSANRGSCLQLCRRPYLLTEIDGDVQIEVDREYLMSPKDLKTIDFLDKIKEAGVSVLKIEGRGRSADYVKTVTHIYKEAVQSLANGTYNSERIEQWNKELATVYNRGFWNGYYLGKNIGEWTKQYGSKATTQKTYIGKITNYFTNIGVAEVKIEAGVLHKGDNYIVIGNTTGVYEDVLNEVRLDLKPVDMVKQGDLCSIPTKELLRRGDKLYLVEDL